MEESLNRKTIRKRQGTAFFLLFALVFVWFISFTSDWHSQNSSLVPQKLQLGWKEVGDEKFEFRVRSKKLLSNCFGFEGECQLKEEGLQIKLSFTGLKLKKPTYAFFDFMGVKRGWRFEETFYGIRKLHIKKLEGTPLGEFHQTIWNSSGYSDFSQILYIDATQRQIVVSNGPYGIPSGDEEGFVVLY